MKLIHLSHTDLDGYCCQFVTSLYFNDITYLNSDYGKEIDIRLNSMLNNITKNGMNERYLFLITDLNLSPEQSGNLDSSISDLKESGFDIELLLLDHHITGTNMAQKYEWYNLDDKRSATKITYDHFSKNNQMLDSKKEPEILPLIKAVNAIDIWLEDDDLFEVGKVCMRMISSAKELNRFMFSDSDVRYKLYCLDKAAKIIPEKGSHIVLDEKVHFIKKDFFKQDKANNSIDNLISAYTIDMLNAQKSNLIIHYKGKTGVLTFGLRGISVTANQFLVANEDIDFFMNVSGNAMVSLRSSNRADVSKMAQELFDGGGHINAAGGKMKTKINTHSYEKLKHIVTTYINDKV
jgi:oligoribonuclease NrnB/cAMP/cGMP phosphodiesterase (DHH superfamily)